MVWFKEERKGKRLVGWVASLKKRQTDTEEEEEWNLNFDF